MADTKERRELHVNGVRAVMIIEDYSGPPAPPLPPPEDVVPTGQPALLSVATLCNSAIGAGVLSLPFAFKKAGLLGGVLLCVTIGLAEGFTLYVLSKMAERYKATSYAQLVRATLGRKMATFLALLIMLYMWGACTAYMVIVGDVFSSLGRSLAGEGSPYADRQVIILAIGLGCILPTCFIRRLGALAALSSVAIVGFLYTAGVVLMTAYKAVKAREDPWEGVDLIRFDYGALFAVPIVVFGFNCHANAVPIFQELTHDSDDRLMPIKSTRKTSKLVNMISVIMAAILLIMTGYLVVGIAGYVACPDNVPSNILNSLPEGDPWVQAARVFIGIVVAGHYPLSHHPARSGAVDLAGLAGLSEAARDNVVAPVFTLLFVLSSVAVSLFVRDLGDVLHILGGTAAAVLIFFNPGCMLINAAIVKNSSNTLSVLETFVQQDDQGTGQDSTGPTAAAAMRVPLLRASAAKGIKHTGLVYSPGKSWAAGLALVGFAIFILATTAVTTFLH